MKNIIKAGDNLEFYTEEKCFITEILNRADYNNFSLAQARVEPGVTTVVHTLKDTDEAYYILSGKGEMEIDGKITGTVGEKDLVFIPRNTTQRITNTASRDLVFLCICSPRFEISNYK